MLSLELIESLEQIDVKGSDEFRVCCPECDDDKYHMYINLSKGVYICHKCGAKGKLVTKDEIDLSQYGKVSIFAKEVKKAVQTLKTLPPNVKLSEYTSEHWGNKYLYSRGVTNQQIKGRDILACTDVHGIFAWRIIFPIYSDDCGGLKYYVARSIRDDRGAKYYNAPWPKDDTLYMIHGARPSAFRAVICEGIFDALAISRAGYNAIALLGKMPTAEQLTRLAQYNTHGYLIFLDSDALSDSVRLQMLLSSKGVRARVTHVCGHDPDSLAKNNIKGLEALLEKESDAFNTQYPKSKV